MVSSGHWSFVICLPREIHVVKAQHISPGSLVSCHWSVVIGHLSFVTGHLLLLTCYWILVANNQAFRWDFGAESSW